MIRVNNLSKFYGAKAAINNLSFEIKTGEIVGFIGPNGAGKTTTFKCLASLLHPSTGEIFINDVNIQENPQIARNIIGYLPEETPLIDELSVNEYLKYRFNLKNNHSKSGYNESFLESTGLTEIKNKKISSLSKGFKQRVGIAEALLGSPGILLLDEPVNGLDPDQIIKIRNLLISLKESKTIIISSHILSELDLICDKFIIISNGALKAFGTKLNIIESRVRLSFGIIELSGINDEIISKVKALSEIKEITVENNTIKLSLQSDTLKNAQIKLSQIIKESPFHILRFNIEQPNLESLYLELANE
ncbi:MAG: ABC transporter related protein [uncultured bacterium]|nr:MAG: ABC transporter related protein [uncultured bacterium]